MQVLCFLCLFFASAYATGYPCPPPGFDSVSHFDVGLYISASWYIQEQRPLVYQPLDELFCVVASYEFQDPNDPSEGLTVFNYANRGGVNGEATGSSGIGNSTGTLQALIPDINDPSKLLVGPKELEDTLGDAAREFYGDYWVVAVGPSTHGEVGYDWAIISGGPPRVKTEGGCRTGNATGSEFQTNDVGLWLFSRKPVDPFGTKIMRYVASAKGFDISVLRKVEQEGCLYEGALIK